MSVWTFVWIGDDGPSLGGLYETSDAAMDAAYEEWVAFEGGNLHGYKEGTRAEFDAMYDESPDIWIVPLQSGAGEDATLAEKLQRAVRDHPVDPDPYDDDEPGPAATYVCPIDYDNDAGEHLQGCGARFNATPDDEGFVDCPSCGLWHRPTPALEKLTPGRDDYDVLMALSYARTALDDPGSLPAGEADELDDSVQLSRTPAGLYAVNRIDEAMHALDVELHPALALRTMGRLLADVNEKLTPGYDGKTFLDHALDNIDACIDALDGEREI